MAAPEKWWVELLTAGHSGTYVAVNSPSRPKDTADMHVVAGPFTTKAAADKWISRQSAIHVPHLPNPVAPLLSPLSKAAHWIGDVVLHLTDAAMWRSLGWMALGAILVIAGIYLWFRTSSTYQSAQSAVLGAVKAL